MLTIIVSLAIFILTLYCCRSRKSTSSSSSKHLHPLPPSPWRLPWIGNLHQLGALPHRSLRRLSQIHGPLMLLRLGSVPMLVVSSPEAAKEVLKNQDLTFASRPSMAMTKRLGYGARGVITAPYGEGWRLAKKICIVHVLSTQRVQSYTKVIENEVAIMLQKIAEQSKSGPLNLSIILNNLTYSIISRIVLGRSYENQGNRESDEFCELVKELSVLAVLLSVEDFFPKLGWLITISGIASRASTCFHNIDKFLDRVIQDHRQRKHDHVSANLESKHEDLVDLLLSMQEDHDGGVSLDEDLIKPLLLDLVSGGTDTSFVTLEWAISELVRNPRLLAKAKEEIRRSVPKDNKMISEDEASTMEYLDAVVKESLRLLLGIYLEKMRNNQTTRICIPLNCPAAKMAQHKYVPHTGTK